MPENPGKCEAEMNEIDRWVLGIYKHGTPTGFQSGRMPNPLFQGKTSDAALSPLSGRLRIGKKRASFRSDEASRKNALN